MTFENWTVDRATIEEDKKAALITMIGSLHFLIDNPAAQLEDDFANNKAGESVHPTDPGACQWCALGRVAHDFGIVTANTKQIINVLNSMILRPLKLSAADFIAANDLISKKSNRTEQLKELAGLLEAKLASIGGVR